MLFIQVNGNDYPDRLDSIYMSGCYNLTTKPYLIEGAEAIAQMGSKVIKLQLSNNNISMEQYMVNDWRS